MLRKLYIKLFKPTRIVNKILVSFDDADAIIKMNPAYELLKTDDMYLMEE